MGPYLSPASPEPEPPPELRHDLFTAVLLPMGAIAGLILTFALFTTDLLVIPGYIDRQPETDVTFMDVKLGSTDNVHQHIWSLGFATAFASVGACLGYLAGKGLGKLTHWGT